MPNDDWFDEFMAYKLSSSSNETQENRGSLLYIFFGIIVILAALVKLFS